MSAALTLITSVTELLTGAGAAVPIIFATVKLIRDQVDPTLTDRQLIDLMETAFTTNHNRNVQLVAELRAAV